MIGNRKVFIGHIDITCCCSSYLTIFLLLFLQNMHAQSAHKHLRTGDAAYKQKDYSSAETAYRKAGEKQQSLKSSYNLGNSLYQQERYEESGKAFNDALGSSADDLSKSNLYHNLGNSLFKQEKYQESVEAYKQSLKFNPDNDATKKNLMLARQMMKLQHQQQQQQNKNQDNKDGEDGNEQKEQQSNQDKNEQQGSSQKDQREADKKEASQTEGMSRDDAEKLLEIIDGEDKKVQEKLRKASGQRRKPAKDW
jgi:Ca-activated chloride channel homolog